MSSKHHNKIKTGAASPIKDATGKIPRLSKAACDVTARKQAEKELQKVNRALRLISLCNQEMVRATDEAVLLQAVCRLAVESGGYRMAWVGFAEQDEAKSVRPAAQAGFVEGYLDTANITWADDERGRDPTGTAIRTGKLVYTRNMLTDPAFKPWRAAAARRGYASSIALPLVNEGRCLGTLTLYTGEPDAFDPGEIELLTEMAGDLAYGIGALRHRAERMRAEEKLELRESFLAAITENQPGLLWLKDAEGRFLTVNRAFAAACGRGEPEAVHGLTDLDIWPKELAEKYRADDQRVMTTGSACMVEEMIVVGKSQVWHETFKTPVRDDQGLVIGTTGYAHDITGRKRAEAAQLRRNTELAALNSLMGGVNSSLSRETVVAAALREMLNAVHTDLAFLFLREGERLELAGVAPESGRERLGQIPEHRVGECLCGLAVRLGQPLYARDIFNDQRCPWEECKRAGFRSFAALPLRFGEQVIGVIGLASETERDFEQQAGFLETLANAVSASLQNVRLFAKTKQAEETLRESEECFRLAFEEGPTGIAMLDETFRFIHVNPAFVSVLGYSVEEIRTLTFPDITHPDYVQKDVEQVRRLLRGELSVYRTEKRYVTKSGTVLWGQVQVSVMQNVDGTFRCFLAIISDISERKQAEAALRESETRLQSILESTGDGILAVDKTGKKVLKANRRFAEMWRIPQSLVDAGDNQAMMDFVREQLTDPREFYRNESLYNSEVADMDTLDFRDGRIFERHAFPMMMDGVVTGRVWSFRDITERKNAEEAMRRQNEYLTALHETMLDVASQLDMDRLLENILKRAGQLMGTSTGFLDLLEPGDDHLTPKFALGALAEESVKHKNKPGEGLGGKVWQTGQAILVEDYDAWPGRIESHQKSLIRSIIAAPLMSKSGFVGVLGLAHERKSNRTFGPDAARQLDQFARFATIAIENARLYSTAQHELKERTRAEEDLKTILRTTMDGFYLVDADGRLLDTNDAYCRMIGYSREQLLKLAIKDIEAKETDEVIKQRIQRIIDEGSARFETKHRRQDGNEIAIEASVTSLKDGNGKLVVFMRDITER